jgi:cellulose synthase/poly-beta-1,6-N-acetylglucosamine synthase-like glycosyltransferase
MIATVFASIVALAVVVPLAIYTVELAIGLPGGRTDPATGRAMRTVVLIPAHNEAVGLGETLDVLATVAPHDTNVLVVADNCTDATAQIAQTHGAEAIERHDPVARGKGHALAFGRDHLALRPKPPEVVIVLDADCRLAPGSIEALGAAIARAPGGPAQAVNLIAADLTASPMTQIAGFAMVVKNRFRSRGMQRMGGAALLTGTGMAFPWPIFANAHLATGSLVEDLGLGISLTRAGQVPRLIENAGVSSAPAPPDVALVQRTRWEHGFLDTVRRSALPLLASGLRRGSRAEVLLALHLIVPPLALLLMLAAAGLLIAAGLILLGSSMLPATLLAGTIAAVLIVTFIAWLLGGRAWLSGPALLQAPFYILWKIPIYLSFLRRRETTWRRTPRQGE